MLQGWSLSVLEISGHFEIVALARIQVRVRASTSVVPPERSRARLQPLDFPYQDEELGG
jgi:hypothetical protein